jgi:hypothetical protein
MTPGGSAARFLFHEPPWASLADDCQNPGVRADREPKAGRYYASFDSGGAVLKSELCFVAMGVRGWREATDRGLEAESHRCGPTA